MQFLKKIFAPIAWVMQYIQNHFKAMLFLLLVVLIFLPSSDDDMVHNNLHKISLVGPIFEVTDLLEEIEDVTKNNKIKGVLFVVDSPGGAVAPSIEIAYAIKRLREVKPVVVYARGVFASGGYYASIWADEIIANPGSMVGSIGVIMQGADLSELMQKIGITSQSVQAGKYKQIGTPDRKWKDFEVNELNKVIQGTYDMFTQDVADARELEYEKRDFYANAHIFTAHQAKEVGLIDEIGVLYDARNRVEVLSGVVDPKWNKEDKFDKLFKKLSAQTAVMLHTYFPEISLR
ncbi:MAG: signal peptide peptidase SppA [Sulfurimonadaceae bacterium]|jgi:protease-4|nr:signal peptide peptidase SppA [Sulfurimonadaceae bacterium]